MLILIWLPTGGSDGSPSSRSSTAGAQLASTRSAVRVSPVGRAWSRTGLLRPGSMRGDRGAGDQGGARPSGGPDQLRRHRAHAADRHPPLAGAVADHVVEEAAVLPQRRVVGVAEGADQRVGQQHAADGVVGGARLDQLTDRPLDQRRPQSGIDRAAQLRGPGQGSVRVGSTTAANDSAGPASSAASLGRLAADQHARRRRPGCTTGRPRPQLQVQLQLGDDRLPAAARPGRRTGTAGHPPRGRPRTGHRPAERWPRLQHRDRAAGPGQVRGGDQAVVAAADDDHIGSVAVRSSAPAGGAAPLQLLVAELQVGRLGRVDDRLRPPRAGDGDHVLARATAPRPARPAAG